MSGLRGQRTAQSRSERVSWVGVWSGIGTPRWVGSSEGRERRVRRPAPGRGPAGRRRDRPAGHSSLDEAEGLQPVTPEPSGRPSKSTAWTGRPGSSACPARPPRPTANPGPGLVRRAGPRRGGRHNRQRLRRPARLRRSEQDSGSLRRRVPGVPSPRQPRTARLVARPNTATPRTSTRTPTASASASAAGHRVAFTDHAGRELYDLGDGPVSASDVPTSERVGGDHEPLARTPRMAPEPECTH